MHYQQFSSFLIPPPKKKHTTDLYALGLTHCDNMLMLLGACSEMSQQDRDIVLTHMMKGTLFHVIMEVPEGICSQLSVICNLTYVNSRVD